MSRYQKVEGHTSLVRDTRTGAIINTNRSEIARARKRKEAKKQEAERLDTLSKEVSSLQSEISEIKDLLVRLVENKE
jgi:hypothetical protein